MPDPNDLLTALQSHFGLDHFRPGQREIITRILAGTSALALFPTGGGKSLCYQLPALLLDRPVLVISPLLALMQDQVSQLTAKAISAVRLDSTLDDGEYESAVQMIKAGTVQLIYLSPEKLADPTTLSLIKSAKPAIVAIDEAHCYSQWGQSFRPDYRRLPKLIRSLKPDAVLALTATATKKVSHDIRKAFGILAKDEIKLSYARSNLSWKISPLIPEKKILHLVHTLSPSHLHPAVVYCARQATTEDVSAALNQAGISARSYHAGMPSKTRAELLNNFLKDDFSVIVATIAFGMGVDKSNIRSVIHYDLPRSPEAWMQESGRAGRDGEASHTEIIASAPDLVHQHNITRAARPSKTALKRIIDHIFTGEKELLLSPYLLTTQLDVSRQVLDTILTLLEIDGILTFVQPLHRKMRLIKRQSTISILNSLSRTEKTLLEPFLEDWKWFDLLETNSSPKTLCKVITLLSQLELAGDISLRFSHRLLHYRLKSSVKDRESLIAHFQDHFQQLENDEVMRLSAVVNILTSRRCTHRSLLAHLGEKNTPLCGQCSQCRKETLPKTLPDCAHKKEPDLEMIQNLVNERLPALSSAAQLTRFLLGIQSPASRLNKLVWRDDFGILAGTPWDDVYALSTVFLGNSNSTP